MKAEFLESDMFQPSNAQAPVAALVTSAQGEPRAGVAITFTADTPGGTVVNDVVITDAAGIARTVLKVGSALGVYSFTAAAPPPGSSSTVVMVVVSGPPAAIERVSPDGDVVTAGGYLRAAPKVRVTDAAGRAVPNATVTWSPITPADTSCANSITSRDGTDLCAWHLPTPGSFELTASVAGATARFSATALPVPASMTFVSAPDSSIEVSTEIDLPPVVVEVRMPDGRPGAGYPVTFTVPGASALLPAVQTTTAMTDVNGRASAPWRSAEVPARLEASASLDGVLRIATSVRTFATPHFSTLAAGRSHACGYAGHLYSFVCWGSNAVQQAGGAVGAPDHLLPFAFRQVPYVIASHWALGDFSCYIERYPSGKTFAETKRCWGLLPGGVETSGIPVSTPPSAFQIPGFEGAVLDGPVSTRVDGGLHACASTATPAVWCVGRNDRGQLGDGTTIDRTSPVLVTGSTALKLALPILGESHSCALAPGGAWTCWGRNDAGQLGDGTLVDRSTPAPVAISPAFVSLAAGVAHTCGLTSAGAAYCWGDDSYGQLGIGAIGGNAATPQLVSGGYAFRSITTGDQHTCGLLTTGGVAYCWGRNTRGQLGDGTRTNRGVPTRVEDLHAPR